MIPMNIEKHDREGVKCTLCGVNTEYCACSKERLHRKIASIEDEISEILRKLRSLRPVSPGLEVIIDHMVIMLDHRK